MNVLSQLRAVTLGATVGAIVASTAFWPHQSVRLAGIAAIVGAALLAVTYAARWLSRTRILQSPPAVPPRFGRVAITCAGILVVAVAMNALARTDVPLTTLRAIDQSANTRRVPPAASEAPRAVAPLPTPPTARDVASPPAPTPRAPSSTARAPSAATSAAPAATLGAPDATVAVPPASTATTPPAPTSAAPSTSTPTTPSAAPTVAPTSAPSATPAPTSIIPALPLPTPTLPLPRLP